ncbi:MAG: TetR family transcriptional regulator [Actinobacteria bacterium]|nr:TetR family transcriptional regulator [Actinomycetota bacterium]
MPSENVAPPESGDRRARKREARRLRLLDLAADLVDRDGVEGVTMAALAEAADYAPASLYTYFPSRSALLADLQHRALEVLGTFATEQRARWDAALADASTPPDGDVAALARLCAFSALFLTAPDHHPREFRLQQQLLVTPDVEDVADAGRVVPAAFAVLAVPRDLLADAAEVGALSAGPTVTDPLGEAVDAPLVRTLSWVVALNGALLTDALVTGLPTTGRALGEHLTDTLLLGWGASPDALAGARSLAATWTVAVDAQEDR